MTPPAKDERKRQMVIGAGILLALTTTVVCLWFGWRHVPGPAGEFLGMMVGLMSTPFILETSFFLIGCAILLVIQAVRRRLDGDEFVTMDELESRAESGTPRHHRR